MDTDKSNNRIKCKSITQR